MTPSPRYSDPSPSTLTPPPPPLPGTWLRGVRVANLLTAFEDPDWKRGTELEDGRESKRMEENGREQEENKKRME